MIADAEKNGAPLVICDFEVKEAGTGGVRFITPELAPAKCCGCFDCWFQTPGRCRFRDCAGAMSRMLAESSELIVISRCAYGGYSEFVKTVLERCLSYVLPFFRLFGNRNSHYPRRRSKLRLRVLFYGDDISPAERETAQALCAANARAVSAAAHDVRFFPTAEDALRYAEQMTGAGESAYGTEGSSWISR